MLRVSKLSIGMGILLLVCSAGGLAVSAQSGRSSWLEWSLALACLAVASALVGIAANLRWQSRTITKLNLRRDPTPDEGDGIGVTRDDLGEVIRIVDSRIIGFLESIPDEPNHKT